MNIVSKVTWRYMKKNKKRTMVTIFGVIISVAMITAVLVSIESFMDMFRVREINESGRWTAEYQNLDESQYEALTQYGGLDEVMAYETLGYSPITDPVDEEKPYLYIQAADGAMQEDMQLEVLEGRLPQAPGEAVVTETLAKTYPKRYGIGSSFETVLGCRDSKEGFYYDQNASFQNFPGSEESFVENGESVKLSIVGIIRTPSSEYLWSPGYTVITWLSDTMLSDAQTLNVRVIFSHIGTGIYKETANLADAIGADSYVLHDGLLRYYGVTPSDSMNMFIKSFGGFLLAIITVGSVMLIYNAFAISLSERSRQLGMLSSVGATRAQKRRSVLFEGALIGLISIPIGIAAGIGGIAVTFRAIAPFVARVTGDGTKLVCVVRPSVVITAVILAVLTILVSSWIPAVRASHITPVESIRQSRDIKLTRRQVKTSRLTRKLFGFPGELALKNLKRNKKSYRVTVISLVLSLTLFISVSGYITMLQRGFGLTYTEGTWDVYADCEAGDARTISEAVSMCAQLTEADAYSAVSYGDTVFSFAEKDAQAVVTDQYKELLEQNRIDRVNVEIRGMNEEALTDYMSGIGMDENAVREFYSDTESGHLPVILIDRYPMVTGSYQWADVTAFHVDAGSAFAMDKECFDADGNTYMDEGILTMDVKAATDVIPMGFSSEFYIGQDMYGITLDRFLYDFVQTQADDNNAGSFMRTVIYMQGDDPQALTEAVKEMCDDNPALFDGYYSYWETEQGDRALMLMLQVFCFGFIILMTLICTANIMNTISTGIDLRRRELAMLKSVGMTPKTFNRMLMFESLFYGIKTLIYGIPIGIAMVAAEYYIMRGTFSFGFVLPVPYLVIAVVVLFVLLCVSMAYSFGKVRRENILDGLRTE